MRHELPSQEDLGHLAEHRATLPAALWAVAIAVASLLGWLDDGRVDPLVAGATPVVVTASTSSGVR